VVAMATKIKTKMDYNLVSARDICEIFASIGGFSGLGHRMLPTKFYPDPSWLP